MTDPIDWNRPIVFRDGTPVVILPRDGWQDRTDDDRQRVRHGSESSRGIMNVVLVDKYGSASRGGVKESPWDVVQQGGR